MNNIIDLYQGYEIRFILPGEGVPLRDCQAWIYRLHKSGTEWHYQRYRKNCHRFECPVCNYSPDRVLRNGDPAYDGYINEESVSITDRLLLFQAVTNLSIYHFILSPSPRVVSTLSDFKKLRLKMLKVAEKSGIKGGVAVFHYFRHPSSYNDRTEICPDQPHWHILGTGHLPKLYKGETLVSGWIIKKPDYSKRNGFVQIYNTASYAVRWGSKAVGLVEDQDGILHLAESSRSKTYLVTWFGILSTRKFKLHAPKPEGIYCGVCEENIPLKSWVRGEWRGMDPPEEAFGIAEIDPDKFEIVLEIYEFD